jgi:hypothetical protein
MSTRFPDLTYAAEMVPGRRDALRPGPSPAGPAADSPADAKPPLSATERTRRRLAGDTASYLNQHTRTRQAAAHATEQVSRCVIIAGCGYRVRSA